MFGDKKILAIIPARGGSKGVPRKNIKELAGKPLIAYTIEQANKSKYIDCCVVSTEDDEIKSVAERCGGYVPFMRPPELARDDTPSIEPVLHVIERLPEYDYMILLQVTSPLRSTEDIDGCIEFGFSRSAKSCVSVTEAKTNPYWTYTLDENMLMVPVLKLDYAKGYQRQKLPKVYELNGACYFFEREFILTEKKFITDGTLGYVMPAVRSYDIDTLDDFKLVEHIMKSQA